MGGPGWTTPHYRLPDRAPRQEGPGHGGGVDNPPKTIRPDLKMDSSSGPKSDDEQSPTDMPDMPTVRVSTSSAPVDVKNRRCALRSFKVAIFIAFAVVPLAFLFRPADDWQKTGMDVGEKRWDKGSTKRLLL